jgi:hypothetical protein
MKRALAGLVLMTAMLGWGVLSPAQQITAVNAGAVVPTLVNYSGSLSDINGKPMSGVVGATFLLYKDEQGGTPLWMETQNVTLDKNGHYTVVLGSTRSQGLPTDLFASGEARWLAVQAQGQAEQSRVLLVSVPYALKAGDAQTVGGLPASAFVLASPAADTRAGNTIATTPAAASSASAPPPASSDVTTTGGTANAIPMFTTATNVQNSILTQVGTTTVSVAGKLNLPASGAATATKGYASRPEAMVASAFNSGTSTAVAQTFQWQAEPANNNTTNPSATLNLLYGSGTAAPAETGLRIGPKGIIAFATGQTFPGTGSGTITKVTAGTDLTGGGSAGAVTLNLDTTKVPLLTVANAFTGNQTIKGNLSDTGNISATGSITAATGAYTANNGSQVVNIKQNGSGSGIASVANGGTGLSGTGNVGVLGTGGPGGSVGVEASSPAGFGVFATTTSGIAVEAISTTPNGVASIEGYANSTASGANTPGVTGYSVTQLGVGTRGLWMKASSAGVNTIQTGVWGDSSAGNGVSGTSDSSVGVYGQSANFHGTAGVSNGPNAAGVNGISTSTGYGVLGYANGSAGQGVWGESFGSAISNGAGSDGVHGVTHSIAGSGVAGVNTATDGTAVYGSSPSGWGFFSDSHAGQARSAGGWVKAMVYVEPTGSGIIRCFNSQLTGSTASTPPCGMTFTYNEPGDYFVDFGFEVDDRFAQLTLEGVGASAGSLCRGVCFNNPNSTQVDVIVCSFNNPCNLVDGAGAFFVVIY